MYEQLKTLKEIQKYRDDMYLKGIENLRLTSKPYFNLYKNHMPKHTNLTNEITGSYYRPTSFFDTFSWKVAIGVVVMIVVCGAILLVMFVNK